MADGNRIVLEPADEFNHDPGTSSNFYESYLDQIVGGRALGIDAGA